MNRLEWESKQLAKRNRDGSFATQKARRHHLTLFARQLDELGYKNMQCYSLRKNMSMRWSIDGRVKDHRAPGRRSLQPL